MSGNNSVSDGGQDKSAPETTVQTVPQNLTTIQSIQTVQGVQTVVPSSIQSIQAAQAVTGQGTTLVGKSISLELNPQTSKILMKQPIGSSIAGSADSKITSTVCTTDLMNTFKLSETFNTMMDFFFSSVLFLHHKCE